VLLLPGVARGDYLQTDFAECELRTPLGPADRGIVDDVTVLGQLYGYSKPNALRNSTRPSAVRAEKASTK
jgi:hypothetical protein